MSPTLLITGSVGVGKTSVAEAVSARLVALEVPHALVDLDQLRQTWPPLAGDPLNHAIELLNLASVASNYWSAGVTQLILSGVIELRSDRADYEHATGGPVTVVRLLADPDAIVSRLRARHADDPRGLEWHVARALELTALLDRRRVADAEVETTGRSIDAIVTDVLTAAAW